MKKKSFFIVGLLGMFGLPLAASAATVCTDGCDYNDLTSAIASTEEVITLNENINLSEKVVINRELTLDLNGYNITGNGQYVLEFNAKDVKFTLTDSNDTAGTITGNQRGILVTAGTLTIDKVNVTSTDRTVQINPVTDGGAAKVIVEGGIIKSTGTNATRTIMLWGNNVAGEASLVVNGGTIIAPIQSDNSAAINLGSNNAAGNTVEINDGSIIGYNGIRLYGNGELGMTVLTMNGGSINAVNAGIIQSASEGTENTEIYLYGGTITGEPQEGSAVVNGDAVAIHHTQSGILVIGKEDGTGPTLIGETGVAIKEGTVTVNGGTIKATGEYREVATARVDGTEDTGAAISITSTDAYASGVSLTINGGTIESDNGNALYEGIAVDENGTPAATVSHLNSVAITNGTFVSSSDKDSVNVAAYPEKGFITGGSYTSDVTEYMSEDVNISQDANGNFVVSETVDTPIITNPSTNDNVITYVIVGAVSLIGLLGASLYLKKNN